MACTMTRRTLRSRLCAHIEAAKVRFLIAAAEADLAFHRAELARLPRQIALDEAHIEALARRLMRAEWAK